MNNKLRKELLCMLNEDQKMCKTTWNPYRHNKHINKLKQIINLFGWPTFHLVGEDGGRAAWLLIQHCDEDVSFQKTCLQMMKNAVKKHEASEESLAYLTDRAAKNNGKKQLYGTPFYFDADGIYAPWPIHDVNKIDVRRKKIGMQPFREYRQFMFTIYKNK